MRWGVRDEMTNEHMTTDLCMRELRTCQELSIGAPCSLLHSSTSPGPNFIYLGGQKYGYRPVPAVVDSGELRLLRDTLVAMGTDVSLLDKWYNTDNNHVPPRSILQPIDSILPNFLNKKDQGLQVRLIRTLLLQLLVGQRRCGLVGGSLRDPGMTGPRQEEDFPQGMLRKAARTLQQSGDFTEEQAHNYHMSVTEREVGKVVFVLIDDYLA